ncbi:MAG: hypothetical protein AAGC99_05550 [Pseudomonadota bacterium]
MSDPRPQELPTDWLDHLVLNMTELEALAARLEQSLDVVRSADAPEGSLSVQILDVLVRVSETAGALHGMASGRLRSLAAAMAATSGNDKPASSLDRPSDRSTILEGDPMLRRRVPISVR